jgi:hypothetical protein
MHLEVEIYSTAKLPFGPRHERGKEGRRQAGSLVRHKRNRRAAMLAAREGKRKRVPG